MEPNSVLILGSNRNSELIDALFDAGLAPIVRETMEGALKKLHQERFMAIVLDRANGDVDALEFILNVRDIDEHVPIIAVGESVDGPNYDELLSQQRTLVVSESFSTDRLVKVLQKVCAAERCEHD